MHAGVAALVDVSVAMVYGSRRIGSFSFRLKLQRLHLEVSTMTSRRGCWAGLKHHIYPLSCLLRNLPNCRAAPWLMQQGYASEKKETEAIELVCQDNTADSGGIRAAATVQQPRQAPRKSGAQMHAHDWLIHRFHRFVGLKVNLGRMLCR